VTSSRSDRIEGNVQDVRVKDRFLHLRYGKEPGDYLILYVPRNCFIHRLDGERLPLKDVQYCDNVNVRMQQHPRFSIQLAEEIEVC
jgi:hypothetical protein